MTATANTTKLRERSRRSRLPGLDPLAVALLCVTGLALPAAANAGRSRSPGSTPGSSQRHAVLSFSRCMRSHGVPNFPNPTRSGVIPNVSPQKLGVSSANYLAAQNACAPQAKLAYSFMVARCIHEHTKSSTTEQTCQEYGKAALGGLP
jgi:hypothetical protein